MELFRALGALTEPPAGETVRLAALLGLDAVPTAADYTELFTLQLYPYASVYVGPEGMLGGEGRDRIAGFWRAVGAPPPPEPDHLAVMLAFYARLVEHADAASSGPALRARAAFFWEHLASWLPTYLTEMERIAPAAYRGWARVLREALRREAEALDPPATLPLHLREAPALPDAGTATLDDVVGALLTPVTGGMIVTRAGLARAGRELGLGLRVGERRFTLRALLAQDPGAMLGWLAAELDAWAGLHAVREPLAVAIRDFWVARAVAARRFVETLGAATAPAGGR